MTEPSADESRGPKGRLAELGVVGQFAALGTTMAGTVTVGLLLGLLVDSLAHTAPVGLVVGLILGSLGAVSAVITLVRRWL